jgi:hypothetical protein
MFLYILSFHVFLFLCFDIFYVILCPYVHIVYIPPKTLHKRRWWDLNILPHSPYISLL